MHSSNSTNTEAQLSMEWPGVNFTAGRMRVAIALGSSTTRDMHIQYLGPGGPQKERERVLHVRNQIPDFSPISLASPSSRLLFFRSLSASLCLSPSPHLSRP